jgi:nucleoside-diphosphate-sugar epimerase
MVQTIAKALGKNGPWLRLPELPVRPLRQVGRSSYGVPLSESRVNALVSRVVYSAKRIQHELGNRTLVSMEEGLRQMVAAWRAGR